MTPSQLHAFMVESNRIEGEGSPTHAQVLCADLFLRNHLPGVEDLCVLVRSIRPGPGAGLRQEPGMDVRVGSYRPPRGGPQIVTALRDLLLNLEESNPYATHVAYEKLHPFMDGNGRSGRLIWPWQMERQTPGGWQRLGFLWAWYYQSLASRG